MAPKESIWLQSAADGLLASTTSAVPGNERWSANTWVGERSVPKLRSATLGLVAFDGVLERVHGHVGLHEIQVRVLGDEDAQSERDEILEPCRNHGWHRRV